MRPGPRLLLAWWAALCLGLAAAGQAPAGQVVLEITTQAMPRQDRLALEARLANHGDDTATNLQAVVLHPPGGAASPLLEALPPGQGATLNLDLPLPPGPPGRYAVPLRLDFQDLNQFPFSAMGYAYYWLGRDRASALAVQPLPLDLDYRGWLEARLTNTEERAVTVEWRVFAPRELAVDSSPRRLDLAAGAVETIAVEVNGVTAQVGAEHPLLIWTAYELDGLRLEKIVQAGVRLVRRENIFRRHLGWGLAGAGLLAAWVTWVQLRSRRRK